MAALQARATIWEQTALLTEARITGDDGTLLTPGMVSSWSLAVYSRAAPKTVAYSLQGQDPSGVVTALQTWQDDATGKNFTHRIAAAAVPFRGGQTYKVEYQLNTDAYGPIRLVGRVYARPVQSV